MRTRQIIRGFAAIGLHRPKDKANVGGVIRAAMCYNAARQIVAAPVTPPACPRPNSSHGRRAAALVAGRVGCRDGRDDGVCAEIGGDWVMAAFTPGPWSVGEMVGFSRAVHAAKRTTAVALINKGGRTSEEREANARLIAAAPELYEALETARDMLLERVHGNPARSAAHNARVVIETALAKARAAQ